MRRRAGNRWRAAYQLKSYLVGAQYDVLAATGVNQDVLEAWQSEENNTGIVSGCGLNRLGHGRER